MLFLWSVYDFCFLCHETRSSYTAVLSGILFDAKSLEVIYAGIR